MMFHYHTCCINSTAEAINDMCDKAREITRRTFLKHVERIEVALVFESYGLERGYVPMNGDCMVSYYKSSYRGDRCYYFEWSRIEFIYLERR